ncbi:MAG: type I secretion C-terminal target domain-containing protein [Aquabacterium sp.]|nr:type I secretion C-terminal target domain-containing protein [Aquabacterium sp.]
MSAGTVTAVWGNAFVRLPDGSLKPVQVGDKVKGGERIITDEDGIVEISPAKGASILVKAAAAPDAVSKAIAGIENQDPDQAPAAGLTGGADGRMQPGLRVDRVSESVGQLAFDFGTGRDQPNVPLASSADQRALALPQSAPEAAPQASINNVDVNEGAGSAVFTITLDKASTSPVTIQYGTQEGTARDGDFSPTSGTVTFNPGETSKTVSVPIKNDAVYEGAEAFTVKLSSPTNAVIAKGTGEATIKDDGTGSKPADVVADDDRPHVVSVGNAEVAEGGDLVFHVKVSNESTTPTELTLQLKGSGQSPATPGVDTDADIKAYMIGSDVALPSRVDANGHIVVTLPANTSSDTDITVRVGTLRDGVYEGPETVQLAVTTPYDTDTAPKGTGTITDEADRPYMLVREGEPAVEGNPVGFNVVLTHPSNTPVTVKLALANITDSSGVPDPEGARIGQDTGTQLEYQTADGSWANVPASGLLTFEPGQTEWRVRVATVDDKEVESIEYVKLMATVVAGDTANGLNVPTSNKTALVDNDLPPVDAINDHVSATDTNLMIVLDTSGSMNSDSGIQGLTRMQAAIQAINKLLDRYDQIGDVAVRLVSFSTDASEQGGAWLSVSDAKALLAELEQAGGDGATYYNRALLAAQGAFDTAAGKLSNAQNVAYFLSDGVPTEPHVGTNFGDGRLSPEQQQDWLNFVDSHQIKSYAIGMGGDVKQTFLDGIAFDGHAMSDTNGVVVSDFNQLSQVLSGTTNDFVQGIISTGGALGQPGSAFHHVSSIVVDGVEHPYQSDVLTLLTKLGGKFSIDMSTGEYSYAAPPKLADGVATETIGFSLINSDGKTSHSTLAIEFDHTHVIAGTSLSETMTGSNTADWLMGRQGDDKIFGDAGNDQLFGNAGHDELHGDAGDDMLVGGQGNDLMFGGTGSDVFVWHLSDRGASGSAAVDTIKDFDAHAPSAGGDVLDLRDLLQGENTLGGTGNLDHYLQFETAGGNTIIKVAPTGDFAPGDAAAGTVSQQIVIEGGHFLSDLGLDTSATNVQVIAKLLQQGSLLVDHA